METVKVTFHKCIQDSQKYGSDDEHMVSRAFFSIEVRRVKEGETKTEKYDNLHADLKQTVGGKYEENPMEVGIPYDSSERPYSGPMNYEVFRNATERYFRNLIGSNEFGICIKGGAVTRMQNNIFVKEYPVEFVAEEFRPTW